MSNIAPEILEHLESKGYRAVEYIESTGTQYIDTGVVCAWGDSFSCEFQLSKTGTNAGIVGSGGKSHSSISVKVGRSSGNKLDFTVGSMGPLSLVSLSTDKHKVDVSFISGNSKIYLDGVEKMASAYSGSLNSLTEWIFAYNSDGSPFYPSYCKLFGFSWSRGGEVVRDYYPCYNISTGAIGLYDMVSDSFFGNNGTGVFLKGADILVPVYYYGNEKADLLSRRKSMFKFKKPIELLGPFTVNRSGKQVMFVKGNLYWDGSEFQIEEHAYDYPTTWDPNHVGHFYWSKTASVAYAEYYNDSDVSDTDNFFAADDGVFEGFTVLSEDEWIYLGSNALAKNSSSYYTISIDGKNCVVFKPDGFSGEVADSYTASEWVEAEKSGLVAFPYAGSRFNGHDTYGYYWTSTPYDGISSWAGDYDVVSLWIEAYHVDMSFGSRSGTHSIRLVKVL